MSRVYSKVPADWPEMSDDEKAAWSAESLAQLFSSATSDTTASDSADEGPS
jgi:hypothetical protein